jgi:GNAT superfamily N-acetyltransferase
MYTDPRHRGKGVNAVIIEALKEWCRSQNITELRLDVYHDNPSAIRAYEKAGFKKHLVNMSWIVITNLLKTKSIL